jgi:phosphoglycerate dehydrogenase-like enzyme
MLRAVEHGEDDAGMARLETLVLAIELHERYLDVLRARFPDLTLRVCPTRDALLGALGEADAALGWQLDPELVAAAPRLRWAQAVGAGVDGFLFPEFVARGILLTNNSGVHAPNMAEHVLALMLAFARDLPNIIRAGARHEWHHHPERAFELSGQTVCVVGLGDIGQALATRAAALGMRVTGVRRRVGAPPPGVERVASLDAMDALLAEAEHVALCLPLTAATRNVFDAARLARLKPGAYLYNVGRGELVDQPALIEALRAGRLAGAGLDVTVPEPLPPDNALWELPNVVITSHTSGATPRYWERGIEILAENVRRYRADEPLLNLVDVDEGY